MTSPPKPKPKPSPVRAATVLFCLGTTTAGLALGSSNEGAPTIAPAALDAAQPVGAAQALDALMTRARQSNLARYRAAHLDLERAERALMTTVDPSHLELQSEGLGDSLSREPNAIDTIRWIRPVAAPWRAPARRDARTALERWHRAESQLRATDVAAEVADLWLNWAAHQANLKVREDRLQRIERALRVFEARFERGEVAGTEVRQLEAQRAEDLAAVLEERLRSNEHRLTLESWLAVPPPPPRPYSLSQLQGWLEATIRQDHSESRPSQQIERIQARADLDQALARLREKTASGNPAVTLEFERIPALDGARAVEALGVQVSIPLSFGRDVRERRGAARRNADLAAVTASRSQAALARDLELWSSRRVSAAEGLKDLRSAVERLPRTEHSLSEQFRLGAITYVVFLDGLARLDDVRLREIELQTLFLRSSIALARLSGNASHFPLGPFDPTSGSRSAPEEKP